MLNVIVRTVNKLASWRVCGGIPGAASRFRSTSYVGQSIISTTMECYTESKLSCDAEYEKAIQTLNTLQSNADKIRRSIAMDNKQMKLDNMIKHLKRSGLTLEDVEKQSFIHVSGTKGKGSTCAITESILRAHGVRTGFFSSPHLVSVTERFRINGEPYSKKKFSKFFWKVYNALYNGREHSNDMPAYFKFLTILCFHIFIAERVDVIILEVGIGGEFDCTNIIRNTKTVGITSLGLEHTQLLGNTLKEIAWQKAGIIKPYSHVFTSATQPECLEVIRERAYEKNASVNVVPPLEMYFNEKEMLPLKEKLNEVIRLNGSLSIQLANDWLRVYKPGFADNIVNDTKLTTKVLNGILQCTWPGRCHMLKFYNLNFYLDGAHTVESIHLCCEWFSKCTRNSLSPKILIFNMTGNRDVEKLLRIIEENNKFNLACFVPNIASGHVKSSDNISVRGISDQITRAKLHSDIWRKISTDGTVRTFSSISNCIEYIRTQYGSKGEFDVLVTGSLHLIGSFLVGLVEYKNRFENV